MAISNLKIILTLTSERKLVAVESEDIQIGRAHV
jgi:hypothetical protein